MNIKIGDKVRIKTEQELLADGWIPGFDNNGVLQYFTTPYDLPGWNLVWKSAWGETIRITGIGGEEVYYGSGSISLDALAEKVPLTLDEYICSLPLEERADLFVYCCEYGYTSNFIKGYYASYDEALKATIETLKQPKE